MRHGLGRHHAIEELGIVKVERGEIRAEKLEERLVPRVPFPHKHDFHQLLVITHGQGIHEIDFRLHKVKPRVVFAMRPGQVHEWRLKAGTRGFVIDFTEQSLDKGRLAAVPEVETLREDEWKVLRFLCEEMCREFSSREPGSDLLLRDYLSAILTRLARRGGSGAKAASHDLEKFTRLVEENFRAKHEVEFYAQTLGLSPQALTMRTTRAFGKSAREIIHERCLTEAKRLLAYSPLSITQISDELGFGDPNYFARFFKKGTATTPGAFRKKRRS